MAAVGSTAVRGLQAELRAAIRGRGALRRPATVRCTRPDTSNYRMPPIGVVVRVMSTSLRRSAASRRPRTRRSSSAAAARASPAGLRHGRPHRLFEVPQRHRRDQPDRRLARVQPGCVLRPPARRGGRHGMTFGPGRQSTHASCTLRRDDRQRGSCRRHSSRGGFPWAGAARRRQPRRARGPHVSRRAAADGPGGVGTPEGMASGCALSLTRTRRNPRALPADPAPRLGLRPRRAPAGERLRSRALLRHGGDVHHRPRGDARTDPEAEGRSLLAVAYPDKFSTPIRHARARASGRSRSKAWTARSMADMTKRRDPRSRAVGLLPDGGGWRLVPSSAATRRTRPTRRPRAHA